MADIRNPRVTVLKGTLFLVVGVLAGGLLLLEHSDARTAFLLVVTVWCACRFYYFAFYVIQHDVDPGHRFAGLWSFARYMLRRFGDAEA